MRKGIQYIRLVGLLLFFGFFMSKSEAQSRLLVGRVVAAMSNRSTEGIMVEAKKSKGTAFTDGQGYFSLNVDPHDTLYYYVGKLAKSIPYPIDSIRNWESYTIAIQTIEWDMAKARKYGMPIEGLDPNVTLENVTVVSRNYHKDSLENRLEYDKVFNYTNPKFNPFTPVSSVANLFAVKKKKRMKRMKNDLLFEEQQGYVDTRFNRTSVKKSIGAPIDDTTLENYMRRYRPSYQDAVGMENISMVMYIRKTFALYQDSVNAPHKTVDKAVINKK